MASRCAGTRMTRSRTRAESSLLAAEHPRAYVPVPRHILRITLSASCLECPFEMGMSGRHA